MVRGVLFVAMLLIVMVVQVTVVNLLPLPGEAVPDLVLLAVVGYALARGATAGAVMGFTVGLVSDVLPPVAHLLGQNAFLLCLVGFIAGRAVEKYPGAGPVAALGCAAAGPVIAVAAGALLNDVRVDLATLTTVLPQAVFYNLLAAPPVVWAARRVVRGPETTWSVHRSSRYPARGRVEWGAW
ncbi:rod shape-determining protein MreD [Streptosporangium becharense]|uniref:Rod shape-determining protein MreD n=1 Tax=Streptosporangium becharense TaxID=1816182 RepID=A0A7W9MIJ2_9ACTN|nr:rod shape-determining protein MreD [Streptosporangium becharense]MBB2913072.1 rod shape-determining protein MreD [Streptosporangium becharense]MBB5822055.1 rod shape-determining protein MreD [Streptosporangium becharense]